MKKGGERFQKCRRQIYLLKTGRANGVGMTGGGLVCDSGDQDTLHTCIIRGGGGGGMIDG